MRDIRKRSAVNKSRDAFERLYEIRTHSILEAGCQGTCGAKLTCGYEIAVCIICDSYTVQSDLKVIHIPGKAEDSHDL